MKYGIVPMLKKISTPKGTQVNRRFWRVFVRKTGHIIGEFSNRKEALEVAQK
jgi:hypothetical protein